MNKIWLLGLSLLLFTRNNLKGEIQEILIRWNAFKCLNVCVPSIERNLNGIRGVIKPQIDSTSGTAVMGWEPKAPFSYEPFKLASAAVGIRFSEIRIRVRGTIFHDAENFYLISTGDDSRFKLVGPINAPPGQYTPSYNLANNILTPRLKDQLLNAEKEDQELLISGPLYLPNQYPRVLIIEQIKVIEEENPQVD
jgi:hypothetical protein